STRCRCRSFFFFQAEDGIRDSSVTGVQTCALPISQGGGRGRQVRPADAWERHHLQVVSPSVSRPNLPASTAALSARLESANRLGDRKSGVEGKGVEVSGSGVARTMAGYVARWTDAR